MLHFRGPKLRLHFNNCYRVEICFRNKVENFHFYTITEQMELVPIHSLDGLLKDEVLTQSVRILNFEWPRSETIRMRGLNSSSDKLPTHLVLVQHFGGKVSVIGHSRISKIPADETQVFIESVVVHPHLRLL